MSDAENGRNRRASRAAELVDNNLSNLADVLDRIRLEMRAGGTDAPPMPIAGNLADRIGSLSDRLRSTDGEYVVRYAKQQVVRHPTLFTIAAAATAAAAVQLAIASFRNQNFQAKNIEGACT